MKWRWWADKLEGTSWTSSETRWIVRWQIWRFVLCKRLVSCSPSLVRLRHDGLWYRRTCQSILPWNRFGYHCGNQTAPFPWNKYELVLKRDHFRRDLMDSTAPRETRQQKSMKRVYSSPIRCYKTYATLFPTTRCIDSETNGWNYTGRVSIQAFLLWCLLRFRGPLPRLWKMLYCDHHG